MFGFIFTREMFYLIKLICKINFETYYLFLLLNFVKAKKKYPDFLVSFSRPHFFFLLCKKFLCTADKFRIKKKKKNRRFSPHEWVTSIFKFQIDTKLFFIVFNLGPCPFDHWFILLLYINQFHHVRKIKILATLKTFV